MADETQANSETAAPAEAVAAVTDAAAKMNEAAVEQARAPAAKAARKPRKTKARVAKPRQAAKPVEAAAANERNSTMNFDSNRWFASFNSFPTADAFQSLFTDAGARGQEAVARSQKIAEDLAEVTRENVEAFAEAGRIAAEGARSFSQDVLSSARQGVETSADAVRALAEAKSPTEFLQLQSELARASFDRFVGESSRLTESAVKLAGEAIQPLSNRASVAADRLNTIVA